MMQYEPSAVAKMVAAAFMKGMATSLIVTAVFGTLGYWSTKLLMRLLKGV